MTQLQSTSLPILEVAYRPKLSFSPELLNLFNYFHNKVGTKEWSGILFYTVEKGSIADPATLEMKAHTMMIKDIGSSAATKFDYGSDIFDFFESNPGAEDMKMGLVHTHHNMKNFFSPTDMEELQDNAPNHNYYLSLIASFDCLYNAKLAYVVKTPEIKASVTGEDGNPVEIVIPEKEEIHVATCRTVFYLDKYNIDALDELLKKPSTPVYQHTPYEWPKYTDKKYAKKYEPKTKKDPSLFGVTKNYTDTTQVQKAISRLIYCDAEQSNLEDIIPILGFKRMGELLDDKSGEVDTYIKEVEEILPDVVESIFGEDANIEEFCEAALLYLTHLDFSDTNPFMDSFFEMLVYNATDEVITRHYGMT